MQSYRVSRPPRGPWLSTRPTRGGLGTEVHLGDSPPRERQFLWKGTLCRRGLEEAIADATSRRILAREVAIAKLNIPGPDPAANCDACCLPIPQRGLIYATDDIVTVIRIYTEYRSNPSAYTHIGCSLVLRFVDFRMITHAWVNYCLQAARLPKVCH